MADEAGRVERRRGLVESGEVIGKTPVTVIGAIADQIEGRRWRLIEQQRRKADAAIAGHHSRDALARLGRHFRGRKERAIVMSVHVDKAGCDDLPADVQLTCALDPADGPDDGYAIAGDR